jgi:predicted nucleic acid-binding protein
VTLVVDTSGLLAALAADQRLHASARRALAEEVGDLVLSPFVLAELDYLVTRELGTDASLELLSDVARGAYALAGFGDEDVADARDVIDRYRDLGIGLADASLVVLAEREGTRRILTLDERHFRALRASDGKPFVLLPADG